MFDPKVETFAKSLFTILKIENLLVKSPFHERYGNQLTRNMIQFNNLMKKFEVAENHLDDYLEWHLKNTVEPKMTKFDFRVELTTLLTNHTLATYEFLKRFFIEVIDLEKLQKTTCSKLPTFSTLGPIVNSFSKLPNIDDVLLYAFFDIPFRNALAHDSWYLDMDGMKYLESNDNLKSIPYSKLQEKTMIIFTLYDIITQEYFKNYYPEIIQYYENEGGDKVANILFPLYGMDDSKPND